MLSRRDTLPLKPAQNLGEVYRVLSPEPLLTPDEIHAFYCKEINDLRGKDPAERLKLRLDSIGQSYFHGFLVGQLGSGKSTEITRFLGLIEENFRPLRIFVQKDLNPVTFGPQDVLLLLIFKLAEAVEALNKELPGKKIELPESLLRDLLRYFGKEEVATNEFEQGEAGAAAQAKIGIPELWSAFLSFGLKASSKIRVGYQEETKLVQYRFQMLGQIADLANRFLEECNEQLRRFEDRQWFVVMEEFDKPNIDFRALKQCFVERGAMFDQLYIHLLITVPVWLFYSSDAQRLPFGKNGKFVLTDTPVYTKDKQPNVAGRQAIRKVLCSRMNEKLFLDNSLELLTLASGGSIRELFGLVREAAENAQAESRGAITREDALRSIRLYRKEFRDRLGTSREDSEQIGYPLLQRKLLSVYKAEPEAMVPDEALNRLLRSRAILEFNGEYWYGVHPLVVDILKEQAALEAQDPGGVE